jgi:dolichol-phosphate mannosyltransferase
MDADFSHDPASLPALLAQSEHYDLVIGSRYVRGGGTRGWSATRRLLSRTANALTRALLHLPLHDCTGGFRCWRADLIERSGALDADVQGYAFLFLTLDRCRRAAARIGEVPILFDERRSGQSKMSAAVIAEAVRVLFRLWLHRPILSEPLIPPVQITQSSTTDRKAA